MPEQIVMTENDRRNLNKDLQLAETLLQDIKKAVSSRIPKAEQMQDHCEECIDRINLLKSEYFPSKR